LLQAPSLDGPTYITSESAPNDEPALIEPDATGQKNANSVSTLVGQLFTDCTELSHKIAEEGKIVPRKKVRIEGCEAARWKQSHCIPSQCSIRSEQL
jgi:hypothetical protein